MPEFVRAYDSSSKEYHDAFQVFLRHTDEKAKIKERLADIITSLPARRTLIDVGAGTGALTAWAGERFDKTVAIEPNPSLREDLTRSCPDAEVIPRRMAEVSLPATGDLVLCSHVLYYVGQDEWLPCVQRMTSWLAPQGALVVILQSRDCDCSRVVSHLQGRCVDLVPFGSSLGSYLPGFEVRVDRMPAEVRALDMATAYTVAEFMMNLLPLQCAVEKDSLEAYVESRCGLPDGGYRLSVDQDFLVIRRKAGGRL